VKTVKLTSGTKLQKQKVKKIPLVHGGVEIGVGGGGDFEKKYLKIKQQP